MPTFNPAEPYEAHPIKSDRNQRSNKLVDEICRGEIAAVESYEQVLQKIQGGAEAASLHDFCEDHRKAADFWKGQSLKQNHPPQDTSGAWGKAVHAIVGTSKILGETAALKALKEGEEHGLKEYQDMLASNVITIEQREAIVNEFVPGQKRHIERLTSIIKLH